MTFITRDLDLQRRAKRKLYRLRKRLGKWKAEFIEEGDEDRANTILSMEFAAESLIHELSMWILLRSNQPEKAWDRLIDAQRYALGAVKAHVSAAHLENHVRKLQLIEEFVFPPQTFVSVGAIVHCEECSICGIDYQQCQHIAGRAYMGMFCSIICKDLEPREISLVKDPADKRCRVTHFSDNSGKRNKMTWRLEK